MGARILIIEDNPANMDLVRYLLEHAGHTTIVANNGIEGFDAARNFRPDLIITDLQMPGMDGFEVLRQILLDPAISSILVVAITAFSMARDRDQVIAAGFSGYISKPIDPETFVQTIDGYLPPGQRSANAGARC